NSIPTFSELASLIRTTAAPVVGPPCFRFFFRCVLFPFFQPDKGRYRLTGQQKMVFSNGEADPGVSLERLQNSLLVHDGQILVAGAVARREPVSFPGRLGTQLGLHLVTEGFDGGRCTSVQADGSGQVEAGVGGDSLVKGQPQGGG